MSMIRASGAMPRMTALQMATASLAVPKSVMKTMVGRVPDRETEAASLRVLEQAALIRASTSSRRANKRMREIINAPLRLGSFWRASVSAQLALGKSGSKKDARQGAILAGRKTRGKHGIALLDCSWVDRRLARRKSDEGRRIRRGH